MITPTLIQLMAVYEGIKVDEFRIITQGLYYVNVYFSENRSHLQMGLTDGRREM